jgi:ribonuclease HI
MGWRENMGILPFEAYAIGRGVEICIAEGRNKVSFETDSKYITNMIPNAYPPQKFNKDTQDYISFLRRKLQKGVSHLSGNFYLTYN